jgi:hypothetical protein
MLHIAELKAANESTRSHAKAVTSDCRCSCWKSKSRVHDDKHEAIVSAMLPEQREQLEGKVRAWIAATAGATAALQLTAQLRTPQQFKSH